MVPDKKLSQEAKMHLLRLRACPAHWARDGRTVASGTFGLTRGVAGSHLRRER